jgi:hypothetical protein
LPAARIGKPEDIAAAVVWLYSQAASFVTGQALAVDGALIPAGTWPAGCHPSWRWRVVIVTFPHPLATTPGELLV